MQNLMLGSSGAGKGYEACVYQILPALQKGRKVITNMPLDLEKWGTIDATFPDLIEMRKRPQVIRGTWEPTREEGAFNLRPEDQWTQPEVTARPFANVWDFYSDWKHPDTGQGPLFVIDEAQYVIPFGKTAIAVEEWSALHRHFNCDIIWITQSYGKLSKTIRDNIQMVYRMRKKTAWGQPDRYIKKVQDGIRGEVMNTLERSYEPKYFGLWKSHTQGGAAAEFNAEDIKSFYSHWTFKGAAICAVLFVGIVIKALFFSGPSAQEKAQAIRAQAAQPHTMQQQTIPDYAPEVPVRGPQQKAHPYDGHTFHLAAVVTGEKEGPNGPVKYLGGYVDVAQNGQRVATLDFQELALSGYEITFVSNRVISLMYGDFDVGFVVDDLPRITAGAASTVAAAKAKAPSI